MTIRSEGTLRIDIEAPGRLPPLSPEVDVTAYRIALEAVTNVTKHAHASRARSPTAPPP